MSEEIEAHILRKFEIVEKKGKGAYGNLRIINYLS
jgi:hypothetical protein